MAITIPLRILLTDPALAEHEDIKDQLERMRKQGHEIVVDGSMKGWDFIAGPNCWLLRPEVAGLFDMAVKNSRRIVNADTERVMNVKASKAKRKVTRKLKEVV